ncbi:MAG TPA: BON domain-containing protein [Ktedonobacterales bacterium]|nr:BON domain-containing protein [Ktedonobacterales bacterium]
MVVTSVLIRPLLQINLGSMAQATDDTLGKVAQVLVQPKTWQISYVVVQRGLLIKRPLALPAEFITEARADGLRLSLMVDDLLQKAQMPKENLLALKEHMPVVNGSENLGGLSELFFDAETRQLAYLVAHRHAIAGGEVLLSADQVADLQAGRLEVKVSAKEFALLPHYRSDPELEEDVRQALWDYPRLRIDLGAVKVNAQCNNVWLRGHVSSDINRRLIEDLARVVPGVRDVHNEVVADTDLAVAVAGALAKHEETRGLPIGVYPDLGEVYLRGLAPTAEARQVAEKVAAEIPDVKTVHNEIVVSENTEYLPTLAGVTGEEDIVPGGEGVKSKRSI